MDAEFQKQFRLFVEALAVRDYSKAVDLMLLLSGSIPVVDLDEVRVKCVQRLRAWEVRNQTPGISYREKSASSIMGDLARIMYLYKVTAEWAFLRIDRTHITLDASLMHLAPEINYTRLMGRYFAESQRRAAQRTLSKQTVLHFISDLRTALLMAPARVHEYLLFQIPIVRRQAMVFQATTSKMSYLVMVIFSKLALALFGAGVLFLLAYLGQYHADRLEPWTGGREAVLTRSLPHLAPEVWLLVIAITFYLWYTCLSIKRRFQQKDIILPDTHTTAD
jgi:predicted unusual protein kinase regulating ubiquinone biosynthesis (AarF/ABC1/UbiB family)